MALIGHWKLQDNDNSTGIIPTVGSSGALRNAGNTSSISVLDGPGTLLTRSLALNISGTTNDTIQISSSMSGSGNRSACMWVKMDHAPNSSGTRRLLFQNTELVGLIWDHANSTYRGAAYHAPNGYPAVNLGAVTPLTGGVWVHLTQTYDGTNIRGYQNGVLQATSTTTSTAGTNATLLNIGNTSSADAGANGRYCDVRIFDSVLSSGDIATIMLEKDIASSGSSGIQSLGSLIHILFPGRQWLVEPGTTGTSSRYSLVGLYSEGNSTGSSTGGSSGTLQDITGISSIATSLAGAVNIIMNMAGISSTYTSSSGTSTVSTANSQFPVGWSNYWQLTATAPTGTVTGFPAFLNLGLLTGLNSIARSDGGDIRVSDTGNNQLACDLLPWYSSGNGGLIINLGTVTGTKTIRVWAGNASETLPAATGTYGQYATYHTGIRGYYPSGAGQDRTSYQNHFAMTGHAGNIGALTNGPISGTKATSFDGASQGIATGTIPTGTPYVLMASHNIRTAGDHAVVLVYSSSVVNKWYELNFVSPSIRAGIFDAGVGGYIAATATNAGLTGTWKNSAAIYPTTGDRSIYVTGLLGQQTFPGVNPGSMNRLAVGYRQAFGRTSGTQSMVVFMTQAVPPALVEYHNRMLANNSQSGFWSSFETSGSFPGSVTGTGLSAVFGNGQYIANNNGSFGGPLYQNIMTFDAGLRTGYSTYRDSIPFSRISGDYGRRFKTEKLAIVPTGVNYPIYLVNSTGGPQNISLASEKNVILVKPNGYNIVVPGTFITDGSDGGLYIMTTGLDMNGKWLFYLQLDGVQSDRYRFEIRGI